MYRTLESCGSLNPMYIVMCTKTRRVLHCWPNTLPSLFDVFSIQQTRTRIKTCTCYVCASDNFSSCKIWFSKGKVPYPEVLDKLKGEVLFFCLSRSWRQIFRRLYYFFFYFFENIVLWNFKRSAQQLGFLPLFKWWLLRTIGWYVYVYLKRNDCLMSGVCRWSI